MKLILASASPRRKELLEKAGFVFETDPADIDERSIVDKSAVRLVKILSIEKAREVAKRHPDSLVIGSDLLVALDDRQIGKPKDEKEAKDILRLLRGKTHQVITGVAVINTKTNRTVSDVTIVDVTMKNYSDDEIDNYVATGEPMDKGGAYATQGIGNRLVEKCDGDPEVVIGLPTSTARRLIELARK